MQWRPSKDTPKTNDSILIVFIQESDVIYIGRKQGNSDYFTLETDGDYYDWSHGNILKWCYVEDALKDDQNWKSSYQSVNKRYANQLAANRKLLRELRDKTKKMHWLEVELRRVVEERNMWKTVVDPHTKALVIKSLQENSVGS